MGMKDQFQDKAKALKEQAEKARGGARDEASERGRQAEDRTRKGQDELRDTADDARDRFQS
ncbi:hypothetical protein ABZS76_35850 [Streptomyces sp. NPDC005562]|uniref:hypothetical protein n=1 Tax=unclassified Streptomyces TaxID=2593676 RepID=UPI0033BB5074